MRRFQLPPLFLIIVFLPVIAVGADNRTVEDDPGTYQWVDDNGTVNFSDNPMSIPGKYVKKSRKRKSVQSDTVPTVMRHTNPEGNREATLRKELYGGHEENWWRARFSELRARIQTIKDAGPEKEARLKSLHFKKVASNSVGMSPGVSGNPRKNRMAYLSLHDEIEADKKQVAALEKELESLESDAARAGIPLEWRR